MQLGLGVPLVANLGNKSGESPLAANRSNLAWEHPLVANFGNLDWKHLSWQILATCTGASPGGQFGNWAKERPQLADFGEVGPLVPLVANSCLLFGNSPWWLI